MATRSNTFVGMLAAATLWGAVGCNFPPNRIGFIEKISQENRKIARSTTDFRTAIAPLKKGEPADPAQVRSAYQAMEKAVNEVQADMEAQPLPTSSSSAKPFLTAYKEYLKGQQKILTDDLQPIVKKVEEPGSPAEKAAFVNGQLAKVSADEEATYAPLMEAQKNYASEHNYTVQSLDTYLQAQKNGKQ